MKTPNFDTALNKILDSLKPHSKQCGQCNNPFEIFAEDIDFYKKLQVPPPALCFHCRFQRRAGFYNNILKFHRKNCAAHPDEGVITTFPPNSPFKIYDLKHWWSDQWGAEEYGRDYDFSRPFFEQFHELNLSVPHPAITHYWKGVIDSPYSISIVNAKNCYFASVGIGLENMHYCYWAADSKDCMECLNGSMCEKDYELLNCDRMFNSKFCRDSNNCIDCAFLLDCDNCQNCFSCFNLRHKNYCFFNQQYSKEEYLEKLNSINLGDRNVLRECQDKFNEFSKQAIHKNLEIDSKSINVIGENMDQSKNCYMVFRGRSSENIRYSQDVADCKDSMDIYIVGPNLSWCYELVEAYNGSNIKFSYFIRDGLNLDYCLECHNCQNCFGCVGLRNKKFHIFNKSYSEEEYWELLDKIKTQALEAGEYGEFFPLSMAFHAYNDTYANVEFPLAKQEVEGRGWIWHDDEEINTEGIELIKAEDVPKDIQDVSEDILNKAIICEKTGKPFRLIKAELEFYRQNNLPVPLIHPQQRIIDKLKARNPSRLWKMNCKNCGKEIYTAYSPEKQKKFIIFCKECYIKEVI